MKKRWKAALSLLLAVLLLLSAAPAAFAEETGQEELPMLSGMFVATELVTHNKAWTQEDWNSALRQLKDVGVDKIVLQYAVQYYSDTYKVYYYTPGFEEAGEDINGRQQTYRYALEACRENGLQCWLGLHLAEDMWFSAMSAGFRDIGEDGKSAFLMSSADYSLQLFDDLWAQFGPAYADVIGGWYLPYEFNNTVEQAARTRLVEDFYQPVTAHIKSVTPDKGIMISPLIYPPMLTKPTEQQLETWKMLCYDVWANSRVDIIAPQDGCGWESSMKENLPPYYQAMEQAREEAQAVRSGKGWGRAIAWNNPELYSMTGSNTMTMRRFSDNMAMLDAYVEEHVSFSLHSLVFLDDPEKAGVNATNEAFYRAYAYLAKNRALYTPSEPIPTPEGLTAEVENGFDARLTWTRVDDSAMEMPIAGYQVRRRDESAPESETILLADVPQPAQGEPNAVKLDAQLENGHTYCYQVYAYDGTGNLSAQPAETTVTIDVDGGFRRTVAQKGETDAVALSVYAVEGSPRINGAPDALLKGTGDVRIALDETGGSVRYAIEIANRSQEPLDMVYLKTAYSPSEGQYFPDKIEVLADGVLVNTIYPQREYGASMVSDVMLPVGTGGVGARERLQLIVTQSRAYFALSGLSAYVSEPYVTKPEGYREPENLLAGQPVAISGYAATQNFNPNDHFRGVDRVTFDYERKTLASNYNLYKGSYASDLLTRGTASLPFVSWQADGGSSLLSGRAADSDRSVWLRTLNLGGESFDLSVDLPTPRAVQSVSTEWLSDRDATVFLPLTVEYYGMTQNGVEHLIGTASRPSEAQINFDLPPAQDNCHRTGSFRYQVLDGSGTVYTKLIARVYPQYPANSHFMRAMTAY